MNVKQIGTVEILVGRVYRLDPLSHAGGLGLDVIVPPGICPLYEMDDHTRFWSVEGQLDGRNMRLGDGLFVMTGFDVAIKGLTVRTITKPLGPTEWDTLLNHPVCQDGDPEQRLRISLETK